MNISSSPIVYRDRAPISNEALNTLFQAAWPGFETRDFAPVLQRSLGYICAFSGADLVGFINLAWDGGGHAFLLDTTVAPTWQRRGIGRGLVEHAVELARRHEIEWVHVDYEANLDAFYRSCGFQPTLARLINLSAGGEEHPA